MLILSRKENEEILIGRGVRVRLIKLGRGRAQIGISAPKGVEILRAELAASASPDRAEAHRAEKHESIAA